MLRMTKGPPHSEADLLSLPSPMAERTLIWDVFDYIFEADRRRMGRIKAYPDLTEPDLPGPGVGRGDGGRQFPISTSVRPGDRALLCPSFPSVEPPPALPGCPGGSGRPRRSALFPKVHREEASADCQPAERKTRDRAQRNALTPALNLTFSNFIIDIVVVLGHNGS